MLMDIHIVFGKKDADIVFWLSSIPKRMMSHYIRSVLLSEKMKTYAVIPVPSEKGLLSKRIDTKIYLTDKSLLSFLRSFGNETMCSVIKRVLRKHLEWNYRNAIDFTAQSVNETAEKTSESYDDDEMSDEYRNMLMEMAGKK